MEQPTFGCVTAVSTQEYEVSQRSGNKGSLERVTDRLAVTRKND